MKKEKKQTVIGNDRSVDFSVEYQLRKYEKYIHLIYIHIIGWSQQ